MSLEQAIASQTAAIEAQTAVLTKLTTAIAVIAAGLGKGASVAEGAPTATTTTPEAPADEPEKKLTRRQRESRMEVPVIDPENQPPEGADKVLPAGERTEAFYKEHVQPVLLGLAALDKEVLKEMFKKFGVAKGSELKPEDWDAAVVAAKALKDEVIARDKRLKEEADADLA